MALKMGEYLSASRSQIRFETTAKRVRVGHAGTTICDTAAALLLWEPGRLVPVYAVPEGSLDAELVAAGEHQDTAAANLPQALGPERFEVHTCAGQPLDVRVGETTLHNAAFRPDDSQLAGYVSLDFGAFTWWEEDAPAIGHPHDPFKRIDTLPSSRHVVVSFDGAVLADSRRAVGLFETHLPVRWYLPREDVRMDLLSDSNVTTTCAYKGHASYFSVSNAGDEGQAIAWTYPSPLHDALPVGDMVCFFAERTDLTVDGERVPRPDTPWSPRSDAQAP